MGVILCIDILSDETSWLGGGSLLESFKVKKWDISREFPSLLSSLVLLDLKFIDLSA